MTATASTENDSRKRAPWKRIALTGGVLLAAGALAGAGAFAVFTDSGTAVGNVDAGQTDINVTGAFTVTDIAPGDTIQRQLTLVLPNATNDGDLVSTVRFYQDVTSETAGTDDPLLAGPGESLVTGTDGLNYRLLTCTVPWTTAATAPAVNGPYTCAGTTTTTGSGKLSTIGGVANAANFTPANFGLTPTATGTFPSDAGDVSLNTLIELVLPTAADNDYENAAAQITFTAAAIQRAGIQK
ncbi:camelysin-like metallo-endopeptidase [Rathayibacter sp. PhB93]|uniref:TasA family protein n=1 Tax=unclassified Rathayibacter TaxID=2609250 RepID=UPI000F498D63|nr:MULTISPECIES: TasA family protein [unclassified Rathayibacter]ROQ16976.1 camelysin-like metallo-endopeptidase [Rathayibacter sp. PhB93]TDQ06808.1 camelysin-like metallo-endopeptidase [Rathayibacter sp. PhB1]TDX81365.1 camelysin-like metallo-endopeptidase [Rathayibacter sp. PhB151]